MAETKGTEMPLEAFNTKSPDYDERAHMEAAIKAGYSVDWDGKNYTTIETLPSPVTIAKRSGDERKQQEALAQMAEQITKMQAEYNANIAEQQAAAAASDEANAKVAAKNEAKEKAENK